MSFVTRTDAHRLQIISTITMASINQNLSTVISVMSGDVTDKALSDAGIRVTPDIPRRVAVYDIIKVIGGSGNQGQFNCMSIALVSMDWVKPSPSK